MSIGAPAVAKVADAHAGGIRTDGLYSRWPGVLLRAGLAVGGGVLLWSAFSPRDWRWTAPLGVGLLTLLVRGRRAFAGFGYGLLAGLGLFAPLLSWTSNVGADAWLALSLLQALFIGALATALTWLTTRRYWPVWTAAAWVVQEAVRERIPFGGFPWGRLAFSQVEGPLLPYAAVGGAPLVTFATALVGALTLATALYLSGARWAAAATTAAAAGLVLAVPVFVPSAPPATQTVSVAAVQGNVPRAGLDAFAEDRAVLDNHAAATRELAEDVAAGVRPAPDLVLWPENSSDLDPYTDPAANRIIDSAVRAVGVPTLVGALVDAGPGRVANTGIVWDPKTGPGATYVKQHPVPSAEYVPYRSLLTRLDERFAMVPRDFVKGQRTGVLQVGPARLGDVICFEVAYDPLVRETVAGGAQLLVVQTNNASFGYSEETEQQLAMSRLRAVEHGRDVLVVATSGVSAAITPDGTVRQRAGLFTAATLSADVGLRDDTTVATRIGGAAEVALAGLVLLPIAARFRGGRARSPVPRQADGSTAAGWEEAR